jgi:hypothetical protein
MAVIGRWGVYPDALLVGNLFAHIDYRELSWLVNSPADMIHRRPDKRPDKRKQYQAAARLRLRSGATGCIPGCIPTLERWSLGTTRLARLRSAAGQRSYARHATSILKPRKRVRCKPPWVQIPPSPQVKGGNRLTRFPPFGVKVSDGVSVPRF